tara:strand:- start:1379 stop:1558 length:180 start_codon:yes stop_codon:yes gene_type:complete
MSRSTGVMQGQYIHEVEQLLHKYEDIEKRMLVMDDYDGGQMHMVRLIIEDLRKMMWWTV